MILRSPPGSVAGEVIADVLGIFPFRRRLGRMSEVCEALFAILEAGGGVAELVFAAFTRFLALPVYKIQEIKIAMELMERIETVYCEMVGAFGLDRIAACFGDEFESELAIRMRIHRVLEK
jgi:hypothetical protein